MVYVLNFADQMDALWTAAGDTLDGVAR